MSKHMTEEELEHDVLIDASAKSIQYIQTHQKTILGVIVAVVVLVSAGLGIHYLNKSKEGKAQNILSSAEKLYESGDYNAALNGDDANGVMGLAEIADSYSGTKAGNLANYYAATSAFKMKEFEKALEYIKEFDAPEGILGVSPITLHATILLELGQHEEAANLFEKAAEWDTNDSTTPYNLLEAGLAYIDAGNTSKAKEVLTQITVNYPGSAQGVEAKKELGLLK